MSSTVAESDFGATAVETRTLNRFRLIAFVEGISYLLLLFVAMPLKYGLGWDLVVTYVGWAHGVLFILYGFWLLLCWTRYQWSFRFATLAAVAALIPFATFWLEQRFLRTQARS